MPTVTASELRQCLPESAAMVEDDGHRILVTRQGKPWLAFIPADEAKIITERESNLPFLVPVDSRNSGVFDSEIFGRG
jgi:PHD/YefM family antitoxin component YafN of YafNO toxin-antitoxin module